MDQFSPKEEDKVTFLFYQCDLNYNELPIDPDNYDYVLMHDVLEHLANPEAFLKKLLRLPLFS